MAISDTITSMQTHIGDAYDAINLKGGTVPTNKNLTNLADAIETIPTPPTIIDGIITYSGNTVGEIHKLGNLVYGTFALQFQGGGQGTSLDFNIPNSVFRPTTTIFPILWELSGGGQVSCAITTTGTISIQQSVGLNTFNGVQSCSFWYIKE